MSKSYFWGVKGHVLSLVLSFGPLRSFTVFVAFKTTIFVLGMVYNIHYNTLQYYQ